MAMWPKFSARENCDARVTQILPTLPKLTSLTVKSNCIQTTYAFTIRLGESGLQARSILIINHGMMLNIADQH
jgi:hypothetical protein